MVVLNKTILILEDDLITVSKLLKRLADLEADQPFSLSTIVLSNYQQVEEFINSREKLNVDIVLLDRDCKLGGSFHVYGMEKFGADNIIAISSVPEYNQDLIARGVKKAILKDYRYLDKFADEVIKEIEKRLKKHSLLDTLKKQYINIK